MAFTKAKSKKKETSKETMSFDDLTDLKNQNVMISFIKKNKKIVTVILFIILFQFTCNVLTVLMALGLL